MGFLKQFKETSASVLPIAVLAAVAGLLLNVFGAEGVTLVEFILSVFLVIVGLTIFLIGVEVGLTPIGNQIGAKITQKRSVLVLLLAGFLLGTIITIAEPDVQVLASQVHQINPLIDVRTLTLSISIGVGLFVAFAFLRSILNLSLKLSLAISVILLFTVASLVDEFFVSVAFDSGGATTGPMAVPFIMAMGLGISASKNDDGDSSFGYAGLASIGPVLFVLILGLIFSGDLNSSVVSESASNSNLEVLFDVFKEVVSALAPLVIICALMQVFFLRMPRHISRMC